MAIGESEFSRARELRHHKSRNAGKIRAVRLHRIGVGNQAKVADREIGVPENKETVASQVPKPRRNRDHSFRGHVDETDVIGEVSIRNHPSGFESLGNRGSHEPSIHAL